MKKKILILICAFMMMTASAIISYASSPKRVTIEFTEFSEYGEENGSIRWAFPSAASGANIIDYEFSKPYRDWVVGRAVTFKVFLEPRGEDTFSKSNTSFSVKGSNASIVKANVSSGKATVTVKWIPTKKLKTPEPYMITDYVITWPKVDKADRYELKMLFDDGGKTSSKTVFVNSNSCDLSQFATGAEVSSMVKAHPKANNSSYLSGSDWGMCDGTAVPADDNTSTGTFTGSAETRYFKSGTLNATGWQRINGSWYYFDPARNGQMDIGFNNINGSWYCFNESGQMYTGWQLVNGLWYRFSSDKDTNEGKMLTGWINDQGYWFYLTPPAGNGGRINNGRVVGSLWVDTTTPDGHKVGKDGKRLD